MDWNGIWNSIKNFFMSNTWNILLFVAVLCFGIIAIKLMLNMLKRIFRRTKIESIAQNFLIGFIKFLLYLVLILVLLSIIGIQVNGIITALSAIVLAIGLALENNIANFANGIVIISTHMFKKGDYIIVNGVEGSVTNINFLFTTLTTPDNKKVTVPNSAIVNNPVINNGANPKRRIDFTFSVAYESDTELVKKIVSKVMTSNGKVYLDPAPFCKLKTFGQSSLNFFANCWVDNGDYWEVYYYIMENVYNEFKRNNITIPYSQIEIRERTDQVVMPVIEKPLPERVEKERQNTKHLDLENDDLIAVLKDKKKKRKLKKKQKKEEKTNKKEQNDGQK